MLGLAETILSPTNHDAHYDGSHNNGRHNGAALVGAKASKVKAPAAKRQRKIVEQQPAAPDAIAPNRRRGRGALSNRSGRFETQERVAVDDGWGALESLEAFKVEIVKERPKTIISRNDSPDVGFDVSINPYRGCEHGCIYCYARPSHAFLGLSAGLDFESRLYVKEGAAALLKREISKPGYVVKTLAIGTNTDPYQPIERTHRVMRQILEVLAQARHPVSIVTKSALVARDLDLLAPMAAQGLVKVALSVTTLDARIARTMEPRAATPMLRLETIEKLAEAGVPTGVMVAPIVPGITDHELEDILTRAHARGAEEAGYIMLRLPNETRDLFSEWLVEHFPQKARHVLSLVRDVRQGKLYDPAFGKRMTGEGPYAWMIQRRFDAACEKIGFSKTRAKLRNDLFAAPLSAPLQLSLF